MRQGTKKGAPWMQYLLCKHEDLSWASQYLHKSGKPTNHMLGQQRQGHPRDSLASQSGQNLRVQNQGEILPQYNNDNM